MQLANQEAQRFNHRYIGTEHVLLALIKEGSGVAAAVLKNLGIDGRKVRREVETLVRAGPDIVMVGKLPQTPRAKKVVGYSIEEAGNLNHVYVGTEHLLLGLLREQEGVAAQVLMNAGLGLQESRGEVTRLLASGIRSGLTPPVMGPGPWGAPIDDLPDDVKAVMKELDAEIDGLRELKEEAVAAQDFERAAALRDEADKLASRRRTAMLDWAASHPIDASWLSDESGVLRLAQRISDLRSWDELPKLADALEHVVAATPRCSATAADERSIPTAAGSSICCWRKLVKLDEQKKAHGARGISIARRRVASSHAAPHLELSNALASSRLPVKKISRDRHV